MPIFTTPCLVRGCGGTYTEYRRVVQDGTGDVLREMECTKNFRHRAHRVDSVGSVRKFPAPRWAKRQLAEAGA